MKHDLNNKGFTLIELLAVLVILTAIMGIAIPTISSSLERNKDKQDQSKIKLLESAGELYVSDNKNAIYTNMSGNTCGIKLETLVKNNLISEGATLNSNDKEFGGYILFNKSDYSYKWKNGTPVEECWKKE